MQRAALTNIAVVCREVTLLCSTQLRVDKCGLSDSLTLPTNEATTIALLYSSWSLAWVMTTFISLLPMWRSDSSMLIDLVWQCGLSDPLMLSTNKATAVELALDLGSGQWWMNLCLFSPLLSLLPPPPSPSLRRWTSVSRRTSWFQRSSLRRRRSQGCGGDNWWLGAGLEQVSTLIELVKRN